MELSGRLDDLLRRERAIVGAALVILAALAWIYLLRGAGMDSMAMDGTGGMPMPAWSASTWALMTAMWWVMMIAMMTPSAAPMILLYGRVQRHALGQGTAPAAVPSGFLAAGYLAAWLAFSLVATVLQYGLERGGLLSADMALRHPVAAGAVLLATGLYQLSPLKHACLRQCRGPVDFLVRHWRPGWDGAFAIGALHGGYCVGCCWLLMALLFVGGVMNLLWIVLLTLLVLAEKLAPFGDRIGRIAGFALLVGGAAMVSGWIQV